MLPGYVCECLILAMFNLYRDSDIGGERIVYPLSTMMMLIIYLFLLLSWCKITLETFRSGWLRYTRSFSRLLNHERRMLEPRPFEGNESL